ncbi:Threonine aldolase [Pseudomonas savastanoi pv. phaseolicola]|nr:Threonine aldolase [Pseudomonas savastanoi pv. phaseolicola]
MTDQSQQFASDNYSGICPEAWAAMEQANKGHQRAYGDDQWTARASDDFRRLFETDCEVFFAFNGTAANSLALSSLCQSYHSVICSETAHVETDECGAPEFFSNGSKLLTARSAGGKLTPESIREVALKRQDIHYPKPRVVTLTQATEVGGVYQPEELKAISATCKELGLHLHMDGARFSNACAFLEASPAELTWKSGVDVLCFGGTKNGMAVGEAILFFNHDLAEDFDYRCKQAGQLASKMRFLSAPWVGLLENDAWLKHARHATPRQPLRTTPGRTGQGYSRRGADVSGTGQWCVSAIVGTGHCSIDRQGLAFLYLHQQRRTLHVLVGHRRRARA